MGRDTEVNYPPPGGELAGDFTGQTAAIERYAAQALRNFKAALEGKVQEIGKTSFAGANVS